MFSGGPKRCEKCNRQVYSIEELKCLDKVWHKGCFKCTTCNSLLNMKTYKGFDKLPYCPAHYPQHKHTAVADNPEMLRIKENTKIQSNVRYHEDFEKNKGQYTCVADDPETRRIAENSKNISQAKYHEEFDKNYKNKYVPVTPVLSEPPVSNNRVIIEAQHQHQNLYNDLTYPKQQHQQQEVHIKVPNSSVPVNSYNNKSNHNGLIATYRSDNHKQADIPVTLSNTNNTQHSKVGSIADYDPFYYEESRLGQPRQTQVNPVKFEQKTAPIQQNNLPHQSEYYNQQQRHQQAYQEEFGMDADIATSVYKAIYDYDAKEDDEISFRDGDKFINCEKIDLGWMIGVHEKTGKHGMFPSNYIEPINFF